MSIYCTQPTSVAVMDSAVQSMRVITLRSRSKLISRSSSTSSASLGCNG